jgi:hypothetical protein
MVIEFRKRQPAPATLLAAMIPLAFVTGVGVAPLMRPSLRTVGVIHSVKAEGSSMTPIILLPSDPGARGTLREPSDYVHPRQDKLKQRLQVAWLALSALAAPIEPFVRRQ